MRFVSVDCETTGLLPDKHQILEIGMVVADTTIPEWIVNQKRWLMLHQHIEGHPFALNMNMELIKEIATSSVDGIKRFDSWERLFNDMWHWLLANDFEERPDARIGFIAAGKNFNGFDRQFLERITEWNQRFVVAHRVFDPTSLYWRPGDKKLPDLATCCERAGVNATVEHKAVADAILVIKCLRAFYYPEGVRAGDDEVVQQKIRKCHGQSGGN